jgi:hypothetical protein
MSSGRIPRGAGSRGRTFRSASTWGARTPDIIAETTSKRARLSEGVAALAWVTLLLCGMVLCGPASLTLAQTTCPPGSARPTPQPPNGVAVEYAPPEIGDVVLKGIVKTSKGYTAMVEDCRYNKNRTLRVGYPLADGRVTVIDDEGITFEFFDESATPRRGRRRSG